MAGKRRAGAQAAANEPEEATSDVAAPPPAPPEPAATTAGPSQDTIERLTQLGKLHEQGVLTDEEFARQKTLLLG